MSSHRSTDELVARLAGNPPPRSLWPSFPVVPLIVCLAFGLLVDVTVGLEQREWSALTSASLTMALVALVAALFGLVLCLDLVSPTGNLGRLMAAVSACFAVLAVAALARAQGPGIEQGLACYWLIIAMASPGLLASLWLLRRGASLHPALVGAGAGMFSSGVASFLFLLDCPGLPDGSGIHAEIAAMSSVSLIGAFMGRRLLEW